MLTGGVRAVDVVFHSSTVDSSSPVCWSEVVAAAAHQLHRAVAWDEQFLGFSERLWIGKQESQTQTAIVLALSDGKEVD